MGSTATQVDKKPYKNQTAGNIGVVKLDHLGGQVGHNIVPYGTVWLSDEEALLTARAPADPADNPFVAKEYEFYNERGEVVSAPMTPIVLIEDEREIPSDERFVPTSVGSDTPIIPVPEVGSNGDRPVPTQPSKPVLAPSAGAAVPPSHGRPGAPPESTPPEPEEDIRASWTENPDRTPTPQPGALSGSAALSEKTNAPTSDGPPQPPAPTSVAAEEHAAETSIGEETGAADTPVGDPPQGEYAQHEEVGAPDAPTATATEDR